MEAAAGSGGGSSVGRRKLRKALMQSEGVRQENRIKT